jgi:uncharacterized heparinase superfamily protein
MRDNMDYMIISCGLNGQNGNGGHAHNDKLSFELCLNGEDVIVDPGTYSYTSEPNMRNLFRSTEFHNTVKVNDLEQNTFDSSSQGLFRMNNESQPRVLVWESSAEHDMISCEHYGFDRRQFHHQRTFHFRKTTSTIRILDSVTGINPQSTAFFHLRPCISIERSGENSFTVGSVSIGFIGHTHLEIEKYWYSPEYGVKEKGMRLKACFGNSLETCISKMNVEKQ